MVCACAVAGAVLCVYRNGLSQDCVVRLAERARGGKKKAGLRKSGLRRSKKGGLRRSKKGGRRPSERGNRMPFERFYASSGVFVNAYEL